MRNVAKNRLSIVISYLFQGWKEIGMVSPD